MKRARESKLILCRFLFAQLHLDSLVGKRSPKAIRNALERLPTGSEAYDQAYDDAMKRIGSQVSDRKGLAMQTVGWITCARRPLTTFEFQHALAIEVVGPPLFDPENIAQVEDIVSACVGLVTVDVQTGFVRLVHYTTQEYFDRKRAQWFPRVNKDMTLACVTYLSYDSFQDSAVHTEVGFDERLGLYPFYYYASCNWGYHVREAQSQGASPEVMQFLKSKGHFEAALKTLLVNGNLQERHRLRSTHTTSQPGRLGTALHMAAYFGINSAVSALLDQEDPDGEDVFKRTF